MEIRDRRLIGFVIRGVELSEEELSLSRFDDFLSLFRRNLLARFGRESIWIFSTVLFEI